jgi:hypothetical protein
MKRLSLVVVAVVVGLSGCVSQSTKNGLLNRCNKDATSTRDAECRDTNPGTYAL